MKEMASPVLPAAPATQASSSALEPKRLRLGCWLIVFVVGLLDAWVHRFQMDFDGVSYLDVAQNYLRGDWHAAVNAYWSPLYSWLLAVPISFLHSSLYWESTLVHLVDFAILLASYAAFEFLLGELLRSPLVPRPGQEGAVGLSESAWRILGLALFLYASLYMSYYDGNTPDLCVTVAAYAAAGLLLRIRSGRAGWRTYVWLGATLGLGYLAKAAMFPLAFVFLGVALFATPAPPRARLKFVAAVFVFALFAGPWIAVLSHSKGRLTFGDSGKLNYISDSSLPPTTDFWGNGFAPGMHFVHPLPRLAVHPPVFVFPAPVSGTFPPWYDPSYWSEGIEAHFHLQSQLRSLHRVYDGYFDILTGQEVFLAALLVLLLAQGAFRKYAARFTGSWTLWLPGLAAMGMYALLHVEPRFVAAFTVLVWLGLFAPLRLPNVESSQRWALSAVLALMLVTSLPTARSIVSYVYQVPRPAPHMNWTVAQELHRLGVPPGGSISVIGFPKDSFYFAHLARVRIVAAVPPDGVNEYWFAPPEIQAKVLSLFAAAGATDIVASDVPAGGNLSGWSHIGATSYWVKLISNAVTTPGPKESTGSPQSTHE
jgi:hypothetical protein